MVQANTNEASASASTATATATATATEESAAPAAAKLVATMRTIQKYWVPESAQYADNMSAYNYISELCAASGVSAGRVNLLPIFGAKGLGPYDLVSDKNELNRRFFKKFVGAVQAASSSPVIERARRSVLTDALRAELNMLSRRLLQPDITAIEREVAELDDAAGKYYSFYVTLLRDASLARAKLAAYTSSSPSDSPLVAAVGRLMENTGWEGVCLQGTKLFARTSSNLVLTERARNAGIDTAVDFGRLYAVYDLQHKTFHVGPAGLNRWSDGYFHPHVSTSYDMCWGNVANEAQRAQSAGEVDVLFHLALAVLSAYNPGNPFRAISNFTLLREQLPSGWRFAAQPDWRKVAGLQVFPLHPGHLPVERVEQGEAQAPDEQLPDAAGPSDVERAAAPTGARITLGTSGITVGELLRGASVSSGEEAFGGGGVGEGEGGEDGE